MLRRVSGDYLWNLTLLDLTWHNLTWPNMGMVHPIIKTISSTKSRTVHSTLTPWQWYSYIWLDREVSYSWLTLCTILRLNYTWFILLPQKRSLFFPPAVKTRRKSKQWWYLLSVIFCNLSWMKTVLQKSTQIVYLLFLTEIRIYWRRSKIFDLKMVKSGHAWH